MQTTDMPASFDAGTFPPPAISTPQFAPRPYGPDLSSHNPHVDVKQVSLADVRFVFLKATEGTGYIDPLYADYRDALLEAGILVSSYHWLSPGVDVRDQVRHFRSVRGAWKPGMLQDALDVEDPGYTSAVTVARDTNAFLYDLAQLADPQPILYSYPEFAGGLFMAPRLLGKRFPLWIASWGKPPSAHLHPGSTWSFWQFTDNGHIPGIPGNVDISVFNGSLAQLQKFCPKGVK